jgi:PTH1 family peptidyl-tRNA hydrolase
VKSEVIDYVLKKPSAEHRVEIEKAIEQALSGIDLLLDGDMERATMKINARPPRPKPDKPVAASAVVRPTSPRSTPMAPTVRPYTRIDTP